MPKGTLHSFLVASAASPHSLSSPSFSPFAAFGSTSNSASRLLAATGCGVSGTIADASGFEDADGNLAVDNAGCADWNSFAPVTWTGTAPYQKATATSGAFKFTGVSDAVNSSTDTSFDGGVKEADECPGTGVGGVNNKTDIARLYVAGEFINGTPYLFLAWVRAPLNTTQSDLHVAFEFNQSTTPCADGDGLVNRTKGDLLIGYDFQSGTPTITVATWTGTTWSAAVTLDPSQAEAAVNTFGTVSDGLKPSGAPDPNTEEFGEAGIDLSALDLSGGGKPCLRFGTASGASRTSGSSTSSQMRTSSAPCRSISPPAPRRRS